MIRIENISKSNSHRILYIEASAALNRGEKIGLAGRTERERRPSSG